MIAIDASPTEFFEALEQFSALWVRENLGTVEPVSRWRSGDWHGGYPGGAVLHYTADMDAGRVMSWFLEERWQARVSAHAVILPSWTPKLRELASGFRVLGTLAAPILQVVPPDKEAWHATWANNWAYGIELVNIGELQCRGGDFFSWRPRNRQADLWSMPWDTADGEPIPLFGRWWVPYPKDQLTATVQLLRWLNDYFDGLMSERALIVGHDLVQHNKRDPGPALPLHAIRQALFDQNDSALHEAGVDVLYGQRWRDDKLRSWYQEKNAKKVWREFANEVRATSQDERWDRWALIVLIFELLGYSVAPGTGDTSVRIFQRMAGLKGDGIVGSRTWAALMARLYDRGMLK